jgi:acetyl esterase/lipase
MCERMKKIFAILLAAVAFAVAAQADTNDYQRVEDVIYGRKFGMALTMDVFEPNHPNGRAIVSVVSGGWFSAHEAINAIFYQAFLKRGYTVFAVVHGSQPKFTITEIVPDVNRAIRFIRFNAKKYGIDPDHIGITGGSAGGHLSLTMGTQGGPGDPKAKDPIDRESSAVQCVACFFPPTDFLNYGKAGEDGVGFGILKGFKDAFGPRADDPESRKKLGHEISPIYFITSNMPPTLILHGNKDNLVPIQQSETFVAKAHEAGATAKLVVKDGQGHGWWADLQSDLDMFADWFDLYLRGIKNNHPRLKDNP